MGLENISGNPDRDGMNTLELSSPREDPLLGMPLGTRRMKALHLDNAEDNIFSGSGVPYVGELLTNCF